LCYLALQGVAAQWVPPLLLPVAPSLSVGEPLAGRRFGGKTVSAREPPAWLEALDTVFFGIDWAVLLATVAFVVHALGWKSLPVVFLPLFCAYSVGKRLATDKWMRAMDAKVAELKKREER